MSNREKLLKRLRALQAKTTARGCTEAEALVAAELAAQIMREHGLSDADVVMDRKQSPSKVKGHAIRAQLWSKIAYCTNTSEIIVTRHGVTSVEFIGREPGPEIAVYLRQVCERALDAGVRTFKAGRFYRQRRNDRTKRQAVAEYSQGFVNRMRQRLEAIFGPQVDLTAIEAANQALATIYPDTREIRPKSAGLEFVQARAHGWDAAGDVHLSHGVGGSTGPRLIGGAS